jgi:hypothetical protein
MADIWFDVDAALSEVPVNIFPLTDDTDFKTRETSVAYNATGMDLVWNFVTTGGTMSQTAVTPTTGGAYDWAHQGDGMYTIEIPASGGASINNDTEGFGWFTGMATGVLPWRSPVFGFRAASLNNALIDGGDLLDVNVTHIADTTQTGRDIGASVLLSSGTGTGQISLSSGAVTVGTNNDKTGYTASTVSDKTGYSLASSQTFNVTGNITGNLSGSVGSVTGAVGSVTGGVTVTTNNDKTGYALTVTPPTAAAIADAVCDEALSGHSAPGTVGISITDTLGYVTALRSALTDLRAAALDRIVGTIAAGTHNPQSGDAYAIVNNGTYGNSALETLVDDIEAALANGTYGLNALLTAIGTRLATTGYTVPPTTSQIADAVLDAPLADHLDAGSVGAGINAAGSAGDPWSTTLPGAYGAGTAGKIIGDNVNATISSRSSHSAADVWTVSVRTLSTFGTLVADVATAVWGTVVRTITGGTITTNSDKTGYSLTVTPPTAVQIRQEMDSNSTQLAAIVADTSEIQVELADGGRTDLLIDGIKAKTDQLTFTTPNSVDATATVSTAGLATEANQTTIINHLTGIKGATFDTGTDSLESIRNRGDAAWITGGGVAGTYAVVINVKDALGVNILDAWVEIWDSAGTAFIEKKQTNSSGNASFNKDAGDYIIRLVKSGYSQTTAEALTISAAGTSNFVMTAFVITAPSNPELCRVYGFFLNPDGTIITGLTGNALVLTYEEDNTVYAGTEVGTYITTGTYAGMMYFDIARGASATVTLDMINYSKAFTVPELDTEELENL